jgi:hypothetical protein
MMINWMNVFVFDDVTQIVPTEHMQLETLTLKIEMNKKNYMY